MWSDPDVFFAHSETGGNVLMTAMAERAVKLLVGRSFRNPIEALDAVFPEIHEFGRVLSGNSKPHQDFHPQFPGISRSRLVDPVFP